MININFIDIDNAKMVGRLLPFWLRGRKMSLLIQSLIYPLISVHQTFKKWALEKYIECQITAQKPSLEWYLKYKLNFHFINEEDEFDIIQKEIEDPKNEGELITQTFVYAPAIVDTVNYNHEDYERDIRYIMSKFMINFNKINVIVSDTI